MIVTASGGGYVLDFEDLSSRPLRYNEVSSAVNSVRSFFGPVDLAALAFIEEKMVPGCVEVAQKFKRLQDPDRASPWYGVSVRSCVLLFGTYVTVLQAREVATRYRSIDGQTSRYSKRLARRERLSTTETVAVSVAF